jgi:hypothetical protein
MASARLASARLATYNYVRCGIAGAVNSYFAVHHWKLTALTLGGPVSISDGHHASHQMAPH